MDPSGRSSQKQPPCAARPPAIATWYGKRVARLPACGRLRHSNLSVWLLAVFIALALILKSTPTAESQERPHDWLPTVLELPQDVEILADRQIGSTLRMLTLSTSTDVGELFVEWEAALRANGYAIGRGRDEPLDGVIEFTGTGIVNAKIIAAPGGGHGVRTVIEIDATLR